MSDQTPPTLRTHAEFRTAIHEAIRKGIEAVDVNAPADRAMVRAVADQVLAVIDPAVANNASSAPRAEAQTLDLDALEALARAASPGLWEVEEDESDEATTIVLNKGTALTRWNEDGTVGYPARGYLTADRLIEFDSDAEGDITAVLADVEYIAAARPEVVLVLIERLRRAEGAQS